MFPSFQQVELQNLLNHFGINVKQVSEITNFPEIMDGRVKTLNPLIYGGILNRSGIDDHVQRA